MADGLIKFDQWGKIAKLNQGDGIIMPFVQEIFLFECDIAGTGFVKDIGTKAAALAAGDIISLVREPENKYDALAIRTDNAAGEKLGYIPRKDNEIPARLLDAGKILYGKVAAALRHDSSSWVDITIKVYMKEL